MKRALAIGALLAPTLVSSVATAHPGPVAHVYVIAIGYNGTPATSEPALQALRFADDDALAFFEFASPMAARAHLLTVFDADTLRRRGDSVPLVKPPSVAEVRAAVADVHRALEDDARAGVPNAVYVYYGGHGAASEGGEPALTLLDGLMTRPMLYDDVLGALPAGHVHLFVDSCHAEAVVRPRDAQAQVAPLTADDFAQYALTTLARFPQVGAVLASTRDAEAHEWDAYQGGIFTHELLSGLRGAADVNGDGRIEYSEIAAFLSAANREVRDPRAHLEAVTHAPNSDPRAAIVELSAWPKASMLETTSARLSAFSVEDERGESIADVHAESRHPVRIVVPAGRILFVRSAGAEAMVQPAPGEWIALEAMAFRPASMTPRGAMETALHRGLFAAAYGPSYYRGFVDRAGDLVAVPLPTENLGEPQEGGAETWRASTGASPVVIGWTSVVAASALTVAAGVFGAMALRDRSDLDQPSLPVAAPSSSDRFARDATVAAVFTGAAVTAAVVGVYLLVVRPGHDGRAGRKAGWNAATIAVDFSLPF